MTYETISYHAYLDWFGEMGISMEDEKMLSIGEAIGKSNRTLGTERIFLGFGLKVTRKTMNTHSMFLQGGERRELHCTKVTSQMSCGWDGIGRRRDSRWSPNGWQMMRTLPHHISSVHQWSCVHQTKLKTITTTFYSTQPFRSRKTRHSYDSASASC